MWTPIALLIDAAGNAAPGGQPTVNFCPSSALTLTMGSLLVGAYRGDRVSGFGELAQVLPSSESAS